MNLMNELANRSRVAHRKLIDDERFWPIFVDRFPVLGIEELPSASRPVSRSGSDITFENLRAIPWVFAWTQMRYNAPGWYGTGSAFDQLILQDEAMLKKCRAEHGEGGFFRAFIDNAQQEMARARLTVAAWYTDDNERPFHDHLFEEFRLAERAILEITGQNALLDNNKIIQQSIEERNGDTDVTNALQVEWLRRWRDDADD